METETLTNEILDQLLGRIYRSLLQYVGESWPWTSAQHGSEEQRTFFALVERQNQGIQLLVDLLLDRHFVLEFPQYPAAFTDLHYLALDFLVREVVKDETELIVEIERTLPRLENDPEARTAVATVLEEERKILTDLRQVSAKQPATA